ncbi:MAG TPA: hypothetical protein VG389_00270 [Myxococcota bacterium]|jgi:hypothetical protein|nr:hypothetical protein [Myxococcota bacterium]
MSQQPTVNDIMAAYALDAVDHANTRFHIDLDFSVESVHDVEGILRVLYDDRPTGVLARIFGWGPSQDVLHTFVMMYGAYVGEVLRREAGGEWFLDTDISPGFTMPGLRKHDARVWPPARVGKRLSNGPEDNVWHYFQAIKENW